MLSINQSVYTPFPDGGTGLTATACERLCSRELGFKVERALGFKVELARDFSISAFRLLIQTQSGHVTDIGI